MKKMTIVLAFFALLLTSCDNEKSLQEYYVEHQQDASFMAFDIPASLLTGDNSYLTPEQKATMETIKKVNFLALPLKEENRAVYEEEKAKVSSILSDEKYQTLMKIGKGTTKAKLYYSGEEEAIDELIVFGSDEEKGFGIARVLGDDMNPEDLIKLFRSVEKGDLNIAGLQNLLNSKR